MCPNKCVRTKVYKPILPHFSSNCNSKFKIIFPLCPCDFRRKCGNLYMKTNTEGEAKLYMQLQQTLKMNFSVKIKSGTESIQIHCHHAIVQMY